MDHIEVAEDRKFNFEFDMPRENQVRNTLDILHYLENADPKTQQEFGEIEQSLRAELKTISRGLPRNEDSVAAAAHSSSPFMFESQEFNKDESTRAKANASEAQFSFPSHGGDPKASGDASLRVRSHHLMVYNTGTVL